MCVLYDDGVVRLLDAQFCFYDLLIRNSYHVCQGTLFLESTRACRNRTSSRSSSACSMALNIQIYVRLINVLIRQIYNYCEQQNIFP